MKASRVNSMWRFTIGCNGDNIPFGNEHFDAVFTNGSLHEWAEPRKKLDAIWRVLKPGGKMFISDLRRDMSPCIKGFMWLASSPKEIRPDAPCYSG